MKISELIEELKKLPLEDEVFVKHYDVTFNDNVVDQLLLFGVAGQRLCGIIREVLIQKGSKNLEVIK